MNNGVKTFNFIRNNSTEAFVNTVPSATSNNIATISNILFNDAYQPLLNEFIGNLVNRIALTIVRNKSFNNPLSVFKKGAIPLGTDIQEIYTNPATAEAYELSNTAMAKLLTITDPDTKVAYYQRNRKDLYTKTISREALQGAFVSWEKFEEFIASITTSLYSGNYIDEFKYTKELVDGAYLQGKAIVETVTAPVDEATSKAFVKKVRALFSKMSFPSTQYNAYSKLSGDVSKSVTTWTGPERVVLIIKADVLAELEVETLAQAFNLSYADLKARIIEVDGFANEEIQAVICDEAWLQIYDNIFRFDDFYNARVMAWNYYLHAWGTYAVSPFANCVILATGDVTPVTGITITSEDAVELDLNASPSYETLEVTLAPNLANSYVEYVSSNPSVFTAERVDNKHVRLTPMSVGSATLTAKSGTVTDTATVTVSAE